MTKLFVRIGGLDRSVSKEDRIILIRDIFTKVVSDVTVDDSNVVIISDKDYGGFRNFCFVTIEDEAVANEIINALDGKTSEEGYQLNINEAKPQEDRPRTGGSSFGGGNRSSNGGGSYNKDRGGDRGGYNNRY